MNEYRPGGFQVLPPVIKNLLIINAVVYLLLNLAGDQVTYFLIKNFALFNWQSPLFRVWQLVTHMFMHQSFFHLFFNMLSLWMFGNVIEHVLGSKRFLIFYFVCGIGAAACFMAVQTLMGANLFLPMLGASGAIYGVLFAFGYLFPETVLYFYFLVPVKAKYAVAIFAVIELFTGIQNNPADNVAHFAHLGGMLFAYLLLTLWKKTRRNTYY